jgi:hypothetical protein
MPDAPAKPNEEHSDALESPEASVRAILFAVGGGLVCVLLSVTVLGFFYAHYLKGGPETARAHPFPAPTLDTRLFRTPAAPIPSTPVPMAPDAKTMDAAMAAVTAKGPRAYDPVGGTTP